MEANKLASFKIGESLFGIDVDQVQEVTQNIGITSVPHAPIYVKGLLNLRGQIATAIGVRELFDLESIETPKEEMKFVICKSENLLLALIVDTIGDVIETDSLGYESVPDTVPEKMRAFVGGVYKLPEELLCVIDFNSLILTINK